MVAQHHRRPHSVRAEEDSLLLRLLSQRCDDLAGERTRTAHRLHAMLRDRNLSAEEGRRAAARSAADDRR
jgi:CRP-like cAMP-binding protein